MSGSIAFNRIDVSEVPWDDLDAIPSRTVFQTLPWLDFLAETQRAEPVVARVCDGDDNVGWFTGAIVKRAGLKVLGSPMRGWTTSYMAFNLERNLDTARLLIALRTFAFDDLGCVHLEVMDRTFDPGLRLPDGFRVSIFPGYERHIGVDDGELMSGMLKNGRRDVRRAFRRGVTVEEVDPRCDSDFAHEYYEQATEVFAKQSLVPTYPADRVEAVIRHLYPAGRLLLLRARLADGTSAATGLSVGLPGGHAVAWMGASHLACRGKLPNEAIMWESMRAWRDRGATTMDFGGGGDYKAKFGGERIAVPWLRASRFRTLESVRGAIERGYRIRQQRRGGRPR